jgi:hypothetical protein
MIMKKRIFLVIACITTSLLGFSQNNQGLKPTVSERFDKLFLSENFDSSGTYWTTLSNSENLILVQDGEYIMQRKAPTSPFAVIGSFKNNLTSFRLVTSLKLQKANTDDGSLGIIFMAQTGGQGGFIFEINKLQQYRLRQISSGVYRYLTGDAKTGGWIKSTVLKPIGLPNLFEVRTAEKNYDLYLNNVLIISFSEIAYKSGDIGYIVGPGSKGSIDFLYLFTNQKGNDGEITNSTVSENGESSPDNDIMALAESIIGLKTQINKLTEENEDLKQIISSMKSAEKDNANSKAEADKNIKKLEAQIKKNQASFDSLLKVNEELYKYKELVKGNDNGDIVINLSKSLKAEKLKNEALTKQNQELKDILQANPSSKKTPPSKPDSTKEKVENGGFVLPKENP